MTKGNKMHPWTKYFVERFNPLFSLVVIIGMALSGVVIDGNLFHLTSFVVACMTIFYIAFIIRLNNDVKDYEKDCIAFRDRALPRGLISKKNAMHLLRILKYGITLYVVILFIIYWGNTRLALLLTSIYLGLLLNDFFAKKWIERRPLVKGLTYHGFVFFLTLLVISIGRPAVVFTSQGFAYAILIFASFFIYDICRKLDPYSHPISLAYVHYFGFKITFWILAALLLLSAICAYVLGVHLWLWTAELVVFLSLSILHFDPKQYQVAKLAASVSLLVHTWAGPLQNI